MISKLRGKSGYTLVEMITVLLLITFLSMISLIGISLAMSYSKLSIIRSRTLMVSDTVNETLCDILRNSLYLRTDGEEVYFVSENYSGWELSLEAFDGRIVAVFHDEKSAERREKVLSDANYAGLKVENFELTYDGEVYNVKYRLTFAYDDEYYEDFGFSVIPGYD